MNFALGVLLGVAIGAGLYHMILTWFCDIQVVVNDMKIEFKPDENGDEES